VRLAFIALALFCGCSSAPTDYDLCVDSCNYRSRCSGVSAADTATCKSNCDAMKDQYAAYDATCAKQCTNCGDINNYLASCTSQDCSKDIQACINSAPACNVKQ
jgi:hypothetical protein